jgi:hypothetical protein
VKDQDLRELYRAELEERESEVGTHRIRLEELEALASGSLPEAERGALLDRVMADPELLREFELLRSVHRAGALSQSTPSRTARWPFMLAAAAVVLLIGATVLLRVPGGEAPPTMRGGAEVEGSMLLSPADGASVESPTVLIWASVPNAVRYQVEVLDADGEAVVRETVVDTLLALPGDLLEAGGEYRWWVEAVRADAPLQSAVRTFRLEP